jgi:hypothetical protein
VDVADRTAWVGEVLLSNEDERALGHRAGGDVVLGLNDVRQGPSKVDGSSTAAEFVRPRDAALDGEVELERGGPVSVTPVRAGDSGGQPVAENRDGRGWCHVE